MEATEYVSPDGATQLVDSPVVAVRLRARGWRPRTELKEAAGYDQAAAERLRLVQVRAEQREERRQQREDEASRRTLADSQPATSPEPEPSPAPEPEPETPAETVPEEKSRPEPKSKPTPKRRTGA
jgi:hypothetical protein